MDDWDDNDFLDNGERGAARWSDPETSHEAAESFNPSHLQGIIIDTMWEDKRGMTTHEIAAVTGIGYQTITPRMKALELKGKVYKTDQRRVWMGGPGSPATNRKSIVWQLTSLRPKAEAADRPEDSPLESAIGK